MKTEVIATLANYFRNEMGKKVLLVVPNTKPKDELKKRYKTRFGEDLPDGWEEDLGIVRGTVPSARARMDARRLLR